MGPNYYSNSAVRRWWAPATVAILWSGFVGLDLWWLMRFRAGFPLDIDEAGYMALAFQLTDHLSAGGIDDLWDVFRRPRTFGPLQPLMTVPFHFFLGRGPVESILVQSIFLGLLMASMYLLVRRLTTPSIGVVASMLVATVPSIIDFRRTYHLAIISAALFTASTYALVRSDRFRTRQWSISWGVLLGLTALSRTVMLAFIPGLLLAAVLAALTNKDKNKIPLYNLGLALLCFFGVASTWYWAALPTVINYLSSYGYGPQSAQYGFGARHSVLSWPFWINQLTALIHRDLYLPLALLCAVSVVPAVRSLVRSLRSRKPKWEMAGRSEILIAVVLLEGYVALSSSRNAGTAFALPLVPLALVLSLRSVHSLARPAKSLFLTVLVIVATMNTLMKANLVPLLSQPLDVPFRGLTLPKLHVLNGRGQIQTYLEGAARYPISPDTGDMPAVHKGWESVSRRIAELIIDSSRRHHHNAPVVFLASRDPIFNANSLALASQRFFRKTILIGELEPTESANLVDSFVEQLLDPGRGRPNFLVTADPGPGEFPPTIDQSMAEEAAKMAGFHLRRTLSLPDGRKARVWFRTTT